jgi:hypothetical protein
LQWYKVILLKNNREDTKWKTKHKKKIKLDLNFLSGDIEPIDLIATQRYATRQRRSGAPTTAHSRSKSYLQFFYFARRILLLQLITLFCPRKGGGIYYRTPLLDWFTLKTRFVYLFCKHENRLAVFVRIKFYMPLLIALILKYSLFHSRSSYPYLFLFIPAIKTMKSGI